MAFIRRFGFTIALVVLILALLGRWAFSTSTVTKGLAGMEDLYFLSADNVPSETFSRATSTGGTITLTKINGSRIPWDNSYTRTIRPLHIIGNGLGTIEGFLFTDNSIQFTDNSIHGMDLIDNTIMNSKFIDNTIDGTRLLDNSIALSKLVGGGAYRGALVYKDPAQSIPNDNITSLTFEYEEYDTDAIHSVMTNISRLTVPTGVTRVRLTGGVTFNDNATGYRSINIRKNGDIRGAGYGITTGSAFNATTIYQTMVTTTAVISVTAGDYFELKAWQNSGSSLDVLGTTSEQTWFCMEIVE